MNYKNSIRVEQAKTLLFLLRDSFRYKSYYVVNLLFLMTSYCFFTYSNYLGWGEMPKDIEIHLNTHFKFWDCSFCCLLFMFGLAKGWGRITWTAYISLWIIWILNFIYIRFKIEVDLYFAGFYFLLGANYIASALWKLINN